MSLSTSYHVYDIHHIKIGTIGHNKLAKDVLARFPEYNYVTYYAKHIFPETELSDHVFVAFLDFANHTNAVYAIENLKWALHSGYKVCKETLLHACKQRNLKVVQYLVHHDCPIVD